MQRPFKTPARLGLVPRTARPSRGPARSLAVDNNVIPGEAPVRIRRYERAVGDAVPPVPPKTAKNRDTHP